MALVKVQGVVLKNFNLNDNDKIITLYTDNLGKIKMVAHGAKKPKSKLMASTQPFCYGEYLIYRGKNLYSLKEASINESFQKILLDFNKILYGSYYLDVMDVITEDENKNTTLLAFLLKTLYILENDVDLKLLRLVFDFKAISLVGYMPNLNNCLVCSNELTFGTLSFEEGGIICSKCRDVSSGNYGVNKETMQLLRIIKNIKLDNLGNIKYDEKTLEYTQHILNKYIDHHIGKQIKSRQLLEEISNEGDDVFGGNHIRKD